MEMEMEAMRVTGTWIGHALPGSLLLVWALYWMVGAIVRGDPPQRGQPLESDLVLPVAKVVLPLVAVWLEIPHEGWYPGDKMMSYHHMTMYTAYALSGVVDLIVRRGVLSNSASHIAFAAAHANSGFLFWGHGGHAGIPGVVHLLLALLFFVVAALAVVEVARPSQGISWARRGALLAIGSWFFTGAWILYLSGWDWAAPAREGWSYMVFSWMIMSVSALTVGARILAQSREVPEAEAVVG